MLVSKKCVGSLRGEFARPDRGVLQVCRTFHCSSIPPNNTYPMLSAWVRRDGKGAQSPIVVAAPCVPRKEPAAPTTLSSADMREQRMLCICVEDEEVKRDQYGRNLRFCRIFSIRALSSSNFRRSSLASADQIKDAPQRK